MRRVLAIAVLALLVFAPAAVAVPPRASLTDLEDEVMCVECGTPLEVSQSPVAMQERDFIRGRIAAGDDKAQIKAAFLDAANKDKAAFDKLSDGKNLPWQTVDNAAYDDTIKLITFVDALRKKSA